MRNRKRHLCLLVVAMNFWLLTDCPQNIASATLIDLGNGVTQDDRGTASQLDDQFWIRDLNRFVGLTYDEQIAAIGNLDNQGLGNISAWHMATYSNILTLFNSYDLFEVTEAFVPTRVEESWFLSWKGRYDRILSDYTPSAHYEVVMHHYLDGTNPEYNWGSVGVKDYEIFPGAFAVAYFASPVPEPSTMILFGIGLFGLVGYRARRRYRLLQD